MRFDMFIIFYYVNATVFILSTFQNYIAPLRKVLDSNPANCVGKKAEEMEQVICKYGMYCQTLLRYCIEALSKAKKPNNGQDCQVREECFKCAHLGRKNKISLYCQYHYHHPIYCLYAITTGHNPLIYIAVSCNI